MRTADLLEKTLNSEKDWRQKEKRVTEDEMVGWHHRLSGHELGQTPGDGGLACCSPCGCKESDATWGLNNNKSVFEKFKFCPHNSIESVLTEVMKSMWQIKWSNSNPHLAQLINTISHSWLCLLSWNIAFTWLPGHCNLFPFSKAVLSQFPQLVPLPKL